MLQIEKRAETISARIIRRTSRYTDDVLRYIKNDMDDGYVKLERKKRIIKQASYETMVNEFIVKIGQRLK